MQAGGVAEAGGANDSTALVPLLLLIIIINF